MNQEPITSTAGRAHWEGRAMGGGACVKGQLDVGGRAACDLPVKNAAVLTNGLASEKKDLEKILHGLSTDPVSLDVGMWRTQVKRPTDH
jgi:hypothetical protein